MKNVKISDLPGVDNIAGTELVLIVQDGINKKTPVSDFNLGINCSGLLLAKVIGADLSAMKYTYESSPDGTFHVGEVITSNLGAWGILISDNGIDTAIIRGGNFAGSSAISNDSGVTRTLSAISPCDHLITLTGGNKFIVTDILITNSRNMPVIGLSNLVFASQPDRGGDIVASTSLGMELMNQLGAENCIVNQQMALFMNYTYGFGKKGLITSQSVIGNSLYYSFSSPSLSFTTVDIYVFGFVLD